MPRNIPALELKGRMLSLTRIRVNNADAAAIDAQLRDLATQMPDALRDMPVLIEASTELDLRALIEQLRTAGMQPIGVADGILRESAIALGLAVLPPGTSSQPVRAAPAAAQAPARRPTQVVESPVRSGQQIYAEGADIIVTGAVSPGAEIIADGCVHIYGPVRGRVIAGARGDMHARVFCHKFDAELVAVAGVYAVSEQMQEARGRPTQAFLENGRLRVESLSTSM